MEERDAPALGAGPRLFVDEANAQRAAAGQRAVEIFHREADVMDPGTAFRDELADRRLGCLRLEQLDERIARGQPEDARAVRIGERHLIQSEHVTIKRDTLSEAVYGDADVGDRRAGGPWGRLFHVIKLLVTDTTGVAIASRSVPFAEQSCRTTEQLNTLRSSMSNIIPVTDDNFEQEVEKHDGLTIVDFWATWCGPCRMIAPILDQLATEYAGKVKVAKLDVDANINTGSRFNVRSIPTLLFFKGGRVVDQIIGAVPRTHIEAKLQQHSVSAA